jgi:hypothetical protein
VGETPTWLIEFNIEPRFAADADRLVYALAQEGRLKNHDLKQVG